MEKARSSRSLRRRCLYLRRLASSNTLTLFFRERSQRRDDRSLTGQKPTLRSDRRHRAVSAWRRAGGRGVDLRYLRQLRMALHRLLGRWTWHLPNRADVQTICQDRGSIRSRACINRLRSSQSDTAAGLVPEPVAIFWRVSLELPARLQDRRPDLATRWLCRRRATDADGPRDLAFGRRVGDEQLAGHLQMVQKRRRGAVNALRRPGRRELLRQGQAGARTADRAGARLRLISRRRAHCLECPLLAQAVWFFIQPRSFAQTL